MAFSGGPGDMGLLSCLDPEFLKRGKWKFFEAVRNQDPNAASRHDD